MSPADGSCAVNGHRHRQCPACGDDDPARIVSFGLFQHDICHHAVAQQDEDHGADEFSEWSIHSGLGLNHEAIDPPNARQAYLGRLTEARLARDRTTVFAPVSQYFLTKSGKTVGPCTLDDLRSYLAYGSVRDCDLTMRAGEQVWMPLRQLEELQLDQGTESLQEITRRRRIVRYREYEKVPLKQQSGWAIQELLLGFLFFPPKLWRASAIVFQERIFRRKADEEGFLTYWPRWVETVVQIMLIVNAVVWVLMLWLVTSHAMPIVRELVGLLKTGIADLQSSLGQ
jgi:hypothetical protein